MLSENSSLRRVPVTLNRKQAVFIDGIRHSAEIIELAYKRLRSTLTELALNPPSSSELPLVTPHAFLDAWAFVDAVDKFRLLYQNFPGMNRKASSETSLQDVTQPFKKIRDIADHCNATAERIVSKDTAGLGILTWLTGYQLSPTELWYCTIRPGTMQTEPTLKWPKIETTLDWPTDCICLSVGGHMANFSGVLPHIEKRIKKLENDLDTAFGKHDFRQAPVANDLFTRQVYKPAPNQEV
jgi:hypothetical protein